MLLLFLLLWSQQGEIKHYYQQNRHHQARPNGRLLLSRLGGRSQCQQCFEINQTHIFKRAVQSRDISPFGKLLVLKKTRRGRILIPPLLKCWVPECLRASVWGGCGYLAL